MRKHQIHAGQRVMDSDGIEGVVLSIEESPFSKAVARVQYRSGVLRPERFVYVDALVPAPLNEPKPELTAKSGDRVRHTEKVDSAHRRTNGTVVGPPVSNGLAVSVLWEGGALRTELLSQLAVTHPAKTDVPHKAQEIIDLIDAECEEVRGQIAAGHVHLRALVAAKRSLMEIR